MQSSSWVTTPATVVKSQLATKSSTQRSRIDRRDYSIHIDFQYTYKGKSYIGKRYDFFRSLDKYSNGGEEAMEEARQLAKDPNVKTYANVEDALAELKK